MLVAAIASLALLADSATAAPFVTSTPMLSEAGATHALQEVERRAVARHAPSAIAIVDGSATLIAFIRMDGARPGSVDLAIGKARSSALMRRPTAELEANVSKGRFGLATSGLTVLRGGAPIIIDGNCVGAVGVAGLDKDQDTALAAEVAEVMEHAS